MKVFISILSIFIFSGVIAQYEDVASAEVTLEKLLTELRSAKNDAEKKTKNLAFKTELQKVLQNRDAMTHPFSSLTTVGVIDSPDGLMRIVNWNVEQDDFSHTYNCFVLHVDKRRNKYHVTELKDMSFGMPTQPTEIITADQWYGALYYSIIPVKKGSKTLYTVLGWDYYSSMSQMRVIDVIYFNGSMVKLGSPIFKIGKETKKRMMYEHSKKAMMSLRYEPNRGRIIFDHLSPESPTMKNFKSFYVPDLSYDAFKLEGSKWVLHEDVIGTNSGNRGNKQTVYVQDGHSGKLKETEIKSEWINPSDPNAPAGGSEHVAITPETAEEKAIEEKKQREPKVDKRDKRDPSSLSFYKDIDKKEKKKKRRR